MQRLFYKDFADPKPAWLVHANQRTLMKANTQIRLSTNESFAAFVGLDWADEKHAVVLLDAHSQNKEHTTLEHMPEAARLEKRNDRRGGRSILQPKGC